MSVERVRQAAKVLRERAEAVIDSDSRPEQAVDHFVSFYRVSRQEGADPLGVDAAYIATMHPGVGLALADWLDNAAEDDEMAGRGNLPPDIRASFNTKYATTVADLILGGAS